MPPHPTHDLKSRISRTLLRVPDTSTYDGRGSLLAGIMPQPKRDRADDSLSDLREIVSQLSNSNRYPAHFPVIQLIDNAIILAGGARLKHELARLRDQVKHADTGARLPLELKNQVFEALARHPLAQSAEGRSTLLRGIVNQPRRDPADNAREDLREIVSQLDGDERYWTADWSISHLLTAAIARAREPSLRAELEQLRHEALRRAPATPVSTKSGERQGDGTAEDRRVRPLSVFISYSRSDEQYKEELVSMLAGLQRRGIVDSWEDSRIQDGQGWADAIRTAVSVCDLALLLVSPHFLGSRYIQDVELPHLLQRRREEQKPCLVPIIIRPCLWRSDPVLGQLQALPKDGKPVITFARDDGSRDQAWADIAGAVEARALRVYAPDP